MSNLIVYLSPGPHTAATEYDYVLSHDNLSVAAQGKATAALLPRGQSDVVAVVHARALSWLQVKLPKGSLAARGHPRLRSVLEGALEERLLDEPAQLHFALAPHASPGGDVQIAVCERAWLHQGLQTLEDAGQTVSRVVPEFSPDLPDALEQWHVCGTTQDAWLVRTAPAVASTLPLTLASVALLRAHTKLANPAGETEPTLWAEPAVTALAEQYFKRPAALRQAAQRWLEAAAQSPWDLAQFDLARSTRIRNVKKITHAWQHFLHAPTWRAARVGLVLLFATHLLGLNLWAWHEKSALQAQRAELVGVLQQTFPEVRVVVDAPLQMERELRALRQSTGTPSGSDLESLLAAASTVTGPGQSATAVEFDGQQVRLKGLRLSAPEIASASLRLKAQGYALRSDTDQLTLQSEGGP